MIRNACLTFGAALCVAFPAMAQQPAKVTDSQLLESRAITAEAEARNFALLFQRMQSDLMDEKAARAAEKEYWKAYVAGLSPEAKVGEAH